MQFWDYSSAGSLTPTLSRRERESLWSWRKISANQEVRRLSGKT